MKPRSFRERLFSFLKGAGSILEIFPPSRPTYEEQFGTDEEMIAADWKAVGDDLRQAIGSETKNNPSE